MDEPKPPGAEEEELLPPGVEQDEQEVSPPGTEDQAPATSEAPPAAAPDVSVSVTTEPAAEAVAAPVSAAPASEPASAAPAQSVPPPAAQAITPVDYSAYGYGAYAGYPAAGAGYAANYGYDAAAYWNYYYPQGYAAPPGGYYPTGYEAYYGYDPNQAAAYDPNAYAAAAAAAVSTPAPPLQPPTLPAVTAPSTSTAEASSTAVTSTPAETPAAVPEAAAAASVAPTVSTVEATAPAALPAPAVAPAAAGSAEAIPSAPETTPAATVSTQDLAPTQPYSSLLPEAPTQPPASSAPAEAPAEQPVPRAPVIQVVSLSDEERQRLERAKAEAEAARRAAEEKLAAEAEARRRRDAERVKLQFGPPAPPPPTKNSGPTPEALEAAAAKMKALMAEAQAAKAAADKEKEAAEAALKAKANMPVMLRGAKLNVAVKPPVAGNALAAAAAAKAAQLPPVSKAENSTGAGESTTNGTPKLGKTSSGKTLFLPPTISLPKPTVPVASAAGPGSRSPEASYDIRRDRRKWSRSRSPSSRSRSVSRGRSYSRSVSHSRSRSRSVGSMSRSVSRSRSRSFTRSPRREGAVRGRRTRQYSPSYRDDGYDRGRQEYVNGGGYGYGYGYGYGRGEGRFARGRGGRGRFDNFRGRGYGGGRFHQGGPPYQQGPPRQQGGPPYHRGPPYQEGPPYQQPAPPYQQSRGPPRELAPEPRSPERWEMVDEDAEDAGMDATKSTGLQPTGATTIMQRLGSPPRAFEDIPKVRRRAESDYSDSPSPPPSPPSPAQLKASRLAAANKNLQAGASSLLRSEPEYTSRPTSRAPTPEAAKPAPAAAADDALKTSKLPAQVKEAAAAALARMQQDKARTEPGAPSLEERASTGVPRRTDEAAAQAVSRRYSSAAAAFGGGGLPQGGAPPQAPRQHRTYAGEQHYRSQEPAGRRGGRYPEEEPPAGYYEGHGRARHSQHEYAEDYEQDYQQFEAGYYEEDRSRRGGREVSPEVGEYVSEDEDAKRAEKKARKKHKKEKKEKKHKKDKRKRSSPGDVDGEAEEREVRHQGIYENDDRMEPHAQYQRQSPAAPPQSTPPQPFHAAKRSRLNDKPAAPVAQPVAPPVAQPAAHPPAPEPMQEDVPEGPAHLHISGLPGYLTKEKVQDLLDVHGKVTMLRLLPKAPGQTTLSAYCLYASAASTANALRNIPSIKVGGRALAVSRISEEDMEPERPPPPAQPRAPPTSAPVSPPRIADAVDAPAAAAEEPAASVAPRAAAAAAKPAAPVVTPVQDPPAAVVAAAAAGGPKPTTHGAVAAGPAKKPEPEAAEQHAHATGNGVSAAKDTAAPVAVTTRVLRLANMVTREELLDPEEYSDIVDDVTSELETKYGTLASIVIPQPSQKGPAADPSGVGLVFVQFANLSNAVRAQTALNGRKFGSSKVQADFFDEGMFQRKHF